MNAAFFLVLAVPATAQLQRPPENSEAVPAPEFKGAPAAPATAPDPGMAPASRDLAAAAVKSEALLADGDLQGARGALDAAVKARPDIYWLVLRYAYLSYLLGDFSTAQAHYRLAASIGPSEEAPVEGLFYSALGRGDPSWKAQAKALLGLNPAHREANLRMAYEEFAARRYESASGHYARVLSLTPEDADALLGWGWSQFYSGRYWAAKGNFERVLRMFPENASAKQGLEWCPRTLSVAAGYSFAALDYKNIAFKKGGHSTAVPVTMAYKKLSLTASYTRTVIDFADPTADVEQKEINIAPSFSLTPKLSLIGAYDHINVNDPVTDQGNVYTGGLNYTTALGAGGGFLSAGGSYTYSDYPQSRAAQVVPHIGIGKSGLIYADFSLMHINLNSRNEKLNTGVASLALGPLRNFTATAKGYVGKKRLAVDDWGTLISNNQDLYRSGWRLGLSWAWKGLTAFGVWGRDSVRANVTAATTLDYTASVLVGGFSARFGY
ncbi:MAG: tetratricopeptide repeat protein [Elusimicrobia bacterium]|nr:tetratricopeptide repeat protein [Elusimicrobiota bacterium]